MDLAWGDGASVSWLIVQLTSFQEKINIPNKMTPHQLEACAILIKNTFGHLKTTELMLFLGMVLGGDFSIDFHGYIQPSKIIDAIRDKFIPYRNRILDDVYQREQEEQRQRDLIDNPPISPEEYKKRTGSDISRTLDSINFDI